MKLATIHALQDAQSARLPVAFAKNLSDGTEYVLPDGGAPDHLNQAALAALAADKTTTHTLGNESWFIESRNPPPRLILIGAVHIAQALVPLATLTGFETILVDPRTAFGNQDRFPGATILNDWPDDAIETLKPDLRTAVVTLTHDPKLDDPALDKALKSNAFYLGALGSRKTHAARLDRLAALGHTPGSLARIHGPVGLNIGAITAPEIALSITAELIATHRGPKP